MTRIELLERLLGLIDEASGLIRKLPDDDRLRDHSRDLEGTSNGGHFYDQGVADDFYYLRDHVELAILKARGKLPADCDPETI